MSSNGSFVAYMWLFHICQKCLF